MKITEIITEAPLIHYEPIGNFERGHSFRSGVDRKLATHPVNIQKIHTFLEKSPFDFRVFVMNLPGAAKYAETGEMSYDIFEQAFGEKIANTVFGSPDDNEENITIVYVGNAGADRVMFTPWVMAHRFGHAIQASARMRGSTTSWNEAEKYFFNKMNEILNTVYNKNMNPRFGSRVDYENPQEYNALFNAIGTMRSARTKQIKRPYEFFYECFAQYLQSGKVTFNPLPKQVNYGRQAWGNPTKSLYGRDITDEVNQDLFRFGEYMTDFFDEVLRDAMGKVYVM